MALLLSLLLAFTPDTPLPPPVPAAAILAPVRASPSGVPAPAARFVWPVAAPRVVRRFDPPPRPWLAGHRGVDLAAPAGSVVRAAGAGTVFFAGVIAGRGVVSVAHPGGLRTTYEPVDSDVRAGAAVTAGQAIGTLAAGHPGCPAAACLHWGLRRGAEYLDPLTLLGLGRVRLLPLDGAQRPLNPAAPALARPRRGVLTPLNPAAPALARPRRGVLTPAGSVAPALVRASLGVLTPDSAGRVGRPARS